VKPSPQAAFSEEHHTAYSKDIISKSSCVTACTAPMHIPPTLLQLLCCMHAGAHLSTAAATGGFSCRQYRLNPNTTTRIRCVAHHIRTKGISPIRTSAGLRQIEGMAPFSARYCEIASWRSGSACGLISQPFGLQVLPAWHFQASSVLNSMFALGSCPAGADTHTHSVTFLICSLHFTCHV
jgi:hypothetical protein